MATTAYPAPALRESVRLTLSVKSGLLIETSATDIGTGMRTILMQTAASELGLNPDFIQVCLGDSDLPEAPTAGRSKSTASLLPAVTDACRALLRKLDVVSPPGPDSANITGPVERLDRSGLAQLSAEGHSAGAPTDGKFSYYSFGVHSSRWRLTS